MQGKKNYQEKLFTNFQLSSRIPEHNFYRRLKQVLDLEFLYSTTQPFYGECGQKSIDPKVFFKFCLVGYLENIISDRQLVQHCSMRLDILFFLGYNIDEELPWHSTISRTRNLFPDLVFDQLFEKVLSLCVDAGMVSGHTQAIDSAPVKANASMDSLELKVPEETLDEHLRKVRYMSSADRPAKNNKATYEQQTIKASDRQLKEIKSRNKKWSKDQDQRPGNGNKNAKYTSNHTHYSPTDPDAKISVKPGKARKLNYTCQMAVDTGHHVITFIGADYANKKDSQGLEQIIEKLHPRLLAEGLLFNTVVADTGYSSGDIYEYLEKKGLQAYIPLHGTYKGGPEGFTYHKEGDYWECPEGKHVNYRKDFTEWNRPHIKKKRYMTTRQDCKECPIRKKCIGKSHEKRIDITYYREYYERTKQRIESPRGRYLKTKRQSTVEPVFGTLTQYLGLRKVNTRGIKNAHKCMVMSGIAYNLKKYLKFTRNKAKSMVNSGKNTLTQFFYVIRTKYLRFTALEILETQFSS